MIEERIAVLRDLEAGCYGLCFYMLREEKSAATAAKAVLTEIYRDAAFWRLPEEDREKSACRMALKSALTWRMPPAEIKKTSTANTVEAPAIRYVVPKITD